MGIIASRMLAEVVNAVSQEHWGVMLLLPNGECNPNVGEWKLIPSEDTVLGKGGPLWSTCLPSQEGTDTLVLYSMVERTVTVIAWDGECDDYADNVVILIFAVSQNEIRRSIETAGTTSPINVAPVEETTLRSILAANTDQVNAVAAWIATRYLKL